jgi:hypothetical protein
MAPRGASRARVATRGSADLERLGTANGPGVRHCLASRIHALVVHAEPAMRAALERRLDPDNAHRRPRDHEPGAQLARALSHGYQCHFTDIAERAAQRLGHPPPVG